MGLKTVPREPWRGGQICGEQIGYGLPGSIFCGEFKMLGSPACEVHDRELREDNYGVLPKFAEGNALGKRAIDMTDDELTLSWETEDPHAPEPATEEEVAAWLAS